MSAYYELQNTPDTPVSLEEVKAFLRVDFTKDDAVIAGMIAAAIEWGQGYTQRDFSRHEWVGFFDRVCSDFFEPMPYLQIQRSPLDVLTSVEVSSGGVYAATDNFIHKRKRGFDVVLLTDRPSIDDTVAYTFRVAFESGYSVLPTNIRQALLEHVAFLYENRGDAPSDAPSQVKNLYAPQKLVIGYA